MYYNSTIAASQCVKIIIGFTVHGKFASVFLINRLQTILFFPRFCFYMNVYYIGGVIFIYGLLTL